jgi:mono/diheme cytochrome c family protein
MNIWRMTFIGLVGVVCTAGVSVHAQESAVQRGNLKFQRTCAPCHGPGPGDNGRAMLPGTASLQLKYKGAVPATLEGRADLPAPVLRTFGRRGSWSMPPFRKTELSDAEIEDIAAYLASVAKGK